MNKIIESDCGNVTILAGDEIPDKIEITDLAKQKIAELCQDEGPDTFLRVAIVGGGCSGFQYAFAFDTSIDDSDIVHDWGFGKVVVDNVSIQFIKGATLDFVNDVSGEYFSMINPSAKSQCGCGQSFAMEYEYYD